MEICLNNEKLQIKINTFGAELTSIIYHDTEYMWQADKTVWARHAPNLFPIVGKLKNNKYTFDQVEYEMSQHGFARDMNFTIVYQKEESLCLRLIHDEYTLKIYPFEFIFDVIYTLDNNEVKVEYKITNPSKVNQLLFSVGAHPGFNISYDTSECSIVIKSKNLMQRIPIDSEEILIKYQEKYQEDLIDSCYIYPVTKELFGKGVLVFETNSETEIQLLSGEKLILTVRYDQMPYLGIWSTYPNFGRFVCIEPWSGLADDINSSGEFNEKKGINRLRPEEEFSCHYIISL